MENIASTKFNLTDYSILLAVALFFYIDFLPVFGSIDIIGTQYLYVTILNIIIGISLFWFPSAFHSDLYTLLKKSWFCKLYLGFLLLCFLSVFSARNLSLWAVSFSHLIICFITIFNLLLLLKNKLHLLYPIVFLISACLFVKNFTEIRLFFQLIKTKPLADAIGSLKGNTGNINILSATINMKMAFVIIGILHFQNWKKWFLILTLSMSVFIIILLDSRATIVALIIETIFVIIFLIWKSDQKSKIYTNILCIVIPIIIGVYAAAQMMAIHKASNTETSFTDAQVKDFQQDGGSVSSRIYYYKNALTIIETKPLHGIGLGNWCIESLAYERKQFNGLIASIHTHNDFLEIATETGLLNGLIYFSLFIILLVINLKRIYKSTSEQSKIIAFLCLLLLVGYGIDSLFNFPLHRPTIQLGWCMLVVFTLLNCNLDVEKSKVSNNFKFINGFLIILSLICTYISYQTFLSYRLENEVMLELMKSDKKLKSAYILSESHTFPNVFHNTQPYEEIIGIYMVNEGKLDEAKKYFNRAGIINPHIGRAEWYKHSIANQQKKKDSAYVYAKQAFNIRPRNFDYFNTMIYMANEFKDTLEILKTHKIYNGYIKSPNNWMVASNGLHNSKYNRKSELKFIIEGLKEFPKDSLLLRRKKFFELAVQNPKTTINFQKPVDSNLTVIAEKKEDDQIEKVKQGKEYLQKAIDFGAANNFEASIEAYKKVLETQPTNASVKQNIGISYFKLNQYQNAIEWLNKTTAAAGIYQDGKSEYVLAACYNATKQPEKCCAALEIAVAKNYTNALSLQQQLCKK